MKIRKNEKGFTLVELLLVMAIIGILATVIFISTAPARKKARITVFKQQMKDLATAASLCIDNNGKIFDANGASSIAANGAVVFCSSLSSTDVVPVIKACRGGSDTITINISSDTDNDDYVLTADCPVTGAAITCHAQCTIGGCKFTNQDNFDAANIDNCPAT